jgi:hypothetical protein
MTKYLTKQRVSAPFFFVLWIVGTHPVCHTTHNHNPLFIIPTIVAYAWLLQLNQARLKSLVGFLPIVIPFLTFLWASVGRCCKT